MNFTKKHLLFFQNVYFCFQNMAFQSDQRIKVQIITALGADQIFRLLSDSDINIVMKTLGLLRNEVAHKSQIDHVMGLFGKL